MAKMEEISETRKRILKYIDDNKNATMTSIIKETGLTRAGVIRHLNESQDSGWITRQESGRVKLLSLTTEGKKIIHGSPLECLKSKIDMLNPDCVIVLKEIIKHPQGIYQKSICDALFIEHHFEADKIKKCLDFLGENRFVTEKDGKKYLSTLAPVILFENGTFHDSILKMFQKTTHFLIDREFSAFPKRYPLDKLSITYELSLKMAHAEVTKYLIENKKGIDDILSDDTLFLKLSTIVNRITLKTAMTELLVSSGHYKKIFEKCMSDLLEAEELN